MAIHPVKEEMTGEVLYGMVMEWNRDDRVI